ncbi:unnamed protein product [Peniophora sp. CBMAI 1063]|nr:unnamed protein product [Peniophora sp. CBMAI 1063]
MATVASQPRSQNGAQGTRGRRMNRPRGGGRGKPHTAQPAAAPASAPVAEAPKVEEAAETAESVDEEMICWICAEQVKYFAVSECNHRTCHVCALRLRALYKKMECTFCKETQGVAIFTTSPDKSFSDYGPTDIPHKDGKLNIFFETQEMMEDSLVLLRFNCPDRTCEYIATGWNDLKLHARGQHGKLMCDICIGNKKVFSHEHVLYAPNVLAMHMPSIPHRRGEKPLPKEQIEGGVHPICEFDRTCFFGDDELYAHMRERHEECFICKRNEVRDQYFRNYEALEKHFDNAHHPCPNSSCQQRKFVVFGTLLDLKAHMVDEHGAEMSTRDRKDAQRVNIEFQQTNGGGGRRRGGQGGGGGQEREPPPHQGGGAGPSSGGGGRSRRERFGGHLTTEGASAPNSAGPSRRQSPSPPPADMDPVTAQRHADLYARLRALAPNPTNAVASLKLSLRSYTASEMGPRDLISNIWNILDRDLDNTASVVNLVIDLLEGDDKKSVLLGAWNGFKLEQRRQFPDLVPTSIGEEWAGIAGGRMLARPAPSAPSRSQTTAVWDRVAQAASSTTPRPAPRYVPGAAPPRPQRTAPPASTAPAFPALVPSRTPAPQTAAHRQANRSTTAWSASASGAAPPPAPRAPPPPSSVNRNVPRGPPPKLSNSAFPELPTGAPSRRPAPAAGNNGSLQKILGSSAPSQSAWTPGGGASASNAPPEAPAPAPEGGKGKKGKGKGKQTLFTLGSFPT